MLETAELSYGTAVFSLDLPTALPHVCVVQIVATTVYVRKVKKLLTPVERRATEDQIAADPLYWPVVPGTGGVRKARGARASSGKRGGVRVIYYFRSRRETIYLLSIYAKGDRADLTPADKKKLRTLVKSLEGT